jgi:hypothetical protein
MSDFEDDMDVDATPVKDSIMFSSDNTNSKGKRSAANLPVEAEDSLPWLIDTFPVYYNKLLTAVYFLGLKNTDQIPSTMYQAIRTFLLRSTNSLTRMYVELTIATSRKV